MRLIAVTLKADGPMGAAGDIVQNMSINDRFPIVVSSAQGTGEVTRFDVHSALNRMIKRNWSVNIYGQDVLIDRSMVFTRGSLLEEETVLVLQSPIIVPSTDRVRAIVTPTAPVVSTEADVEYHVLEDEEARVFRAKRTRHDQSSKARFRIREGMLEETVNPGPDPVVEDEPGNGNGNGNPK